jgi:hypothetical protein
VREIPLSDFGLETVAEVCARKGWAPKTVQNWIRWELIPVVPVGTGRSAKFLVRSSDVDAFEPPKRGPKPGNQNARKRDCGAGEASKQKSARAVRVGRKGKG